MRGFKNFLMRGDVIVVAIGLVIALAFSALVTSFTTNIINPLVQSFVPGTHGFGVPARHLQATARRYAGVPHGRAPPTVDRTPPPYGDAVFARFRQVPEQPTM